MTPPDGALEDASFEIMEGASFIEGPYPDLGLQSTFRWVINPKCRIRLFSKRAGPRTLELRLRNINMNQRLTIYLGDTRVLHDLSATSIATLIRLRFDAEFDVGFHTLEIIASVAGTADASGRQLAYMLEGISLTDSETTDALLSQNMIRWEKSEGFGEVEDPSPEDGWYDRSRWMVSTTPKIVLERKAAGRAKLTFSYRVPIRTQRALLRVNDAEPFSIDFHQEDFSQQGLATCFVFLLAGENTLAFEFAYAVHPDSGSRLLVLLLMGLDVEDLAEGQQEIAPKATQPETPADEPEDGALQYLEGFSSKDAKVLQTGQAFRWAVGPESNFQIYCRDASIRDVTMTLHNYFPHQNVTILFEGHPLVTTKLKLDPDVPSRVSFMAEFQQGWNNLTLRPSRWMLADDGKRPLSVLVDDIAVGLR